MNAQALASARCFLSCFSSFFVGAAKPTSGSSARSYRINDVSAAKLTALVILNISGVMVNWKCENTWVKDSSCCSCPSQPCWATYVRASSLLANSKKQCKPPQIPLLGRFSIYVLVSTTGISIVHCFLGTCFFGFECGNSFTLPALKAWQRLCKGQGSQS